MTYFVTGATGFIGRHLVERLLAREGTIYVLVRPESIGRLDALIHRWGGAGRIRPVLGDLSRPLLGLDPEQVAELRGTIDHFFHLAAVYDMTADEAQDRLANVEGTRHAVALAGRRSTPAASTTPPRSRSPALTGASSARTCSTRASRSSTPTTARSSRPSRSCARQRGRPVARLPPRRRRRQLRHRRDGQDRRALLLLQADPAARRRAAVVAAARRARAGRHEHRAGRLRRRGDGPASRTSPGSTVARSTS